MADEERGIVHTMVMFQHPGNVRVPFWEKQYQDPQSILVYPNSIGIFETFKVQAGRITHITAQMVSCPTKPWLAGALRRRTGWAHPVENRRTISSPLAAWRACVIPHRHLP
jgi:hypothetical protein